MNILFFGKKRHGSGSIEYQRHVLRNLPVDGVKLYGLKMMMNNHTYFFDRFDLMGNAVFVDDQWDESDAAPPPTDIGMSGYLNKGDFEADRMADDGFPCVAE